jgi:BirA family transcriptional regulator, biotin operon repressor / biotin---[acetyl-CoA-carboxylase] ligase
VIAFSSGGLVARRWRSFENLFCLSEVDSSNKLAREFMELYFEEDQKLPPTVILAAAQSQARGRKGDRWHAPAGRGLYFTFVRPAGPGEPLSLVPIAVARWIRDVIEEETGVSASLKWPNDLYVGRRKLAGVLAESRTQGRETYISVGVGMNVLGRAEELGVPGATTLEEEGGRAVELAALAQAVLDRLDRELCEPSWSEEIGRWERAAAHRPGDRMTVRREGVEVTGEYRGLSPEGFLRLETESGEMVLPSGEVQKW